MRAPEPSDPCAALARLRRELLQRAAAFGCDRGDAEDLVQAAFERVLPLDAGVATESLKPLLYVVLKRLAIDRARHRRRWRTTPLEESVHGARYEQDGLPPPDVELEALSQALEHCDPRDRSVFELHYVHGKRYREIAADLGIAMGTVATRLHRARLQLKAALARRPGRNDR